MRFREVDEGGCRIWLGAIESRCGRGYTAAVVVEHHRPDGRRCELLRDEDIACGYRWDTADAALAYALARGRDAVRRHGAGADRRAAA